MTFSFPVVVSVVLGVVGAAPAASGADGCEPTLLGEIPSHFSDIAPGSHGYVFAAAGDTLVLAPDGAGRLVPAARFPHALAGSREEVASLVSSGDLLFASGDAGTQIFDASSPPALVELARIPAGGPDSAHGDAVVEGDRLYIAAGSSSLLIVDISDPSSPDLLADAGLVNRGGFDTVRVSGDTAFVRTPAANVAIFDVSDSSSPVLLAEMPRSFTSSAYNMEIVSGRLLLADNFTISIYNIDDPANPVYIGAFTDGGPFGGVLSASGSRIAVSNAGVGVYDLTDPLAPVLVGRIDEDGPRFLKLFEDAVWRFSGSVEGFGWDGADGFTSLGEYQGSAGTGAVGFDGGTLVAAQDGSNPTPLRVYDIANPMLAAYRSAAQVDGEVSEVRVSDDLVITNGWGIDTLRLTPEGGLTPLASLDGSFTQIVYEPPHLFASGVRGPQFAREYFLQVFDLTDPAAPNLLGERLFNAGVLKFRVTGDLAVVSSGFTVMTLDFSDPSDPQIIGAAPVGFDVSDLAINGSVLSIQTSVDGFRVIDFADPTLPALVESNVASPLFAGRMLGIGENTLLWRQAADPGPYPLLEFTDPARPFEVRSLPLDDPEPRDAVFADGRLAVATRTRGVRFFGLHGCDSPIRCGVVDSSEPIGVLDLADIVGFLESFLAGEPDADFATPFGVLDLADIVAFIEGFTAGCP
jgi:hypothetical protein